MKRVIVQILPAGVRSPEARVELSDESPSTREFIPINGGSQQSAGPGPDEEASVRLEAVISAERARTVVDTALNVNELAHVDSFDRMVDLLIQRELANDDSGQLFNRVMSTVEKVLVEKAFFECGQVQTRTAERLGVNRKTIHKKLLKHELLDPESDDINISDSDEALIEKRKCV